jgi:hypothetical protein
MGFFFVQSLEKSENPAGSTSCRFFLHLSHFLRPFIRRALIFNGAFSSFRVDDGSRCYDSIRSQNHYDKTEVLA